MHTIINIGPLFENGQTRSGGIVVLFDNWLRFCENKGLDTITVDTNKRNYANPAAAFFLILWRSLRAMRPGRTVFIHGTWHDYLYLAPFIVAMAKVMRCRVALRKFAGNFLEYYQQSGWLKLKVLDFVLNRANVQFWETKRLTAYYNKVYGSKSRWFPNVRRRPEGIRHSGEYRRRFLFLSSVQRQKGLDYLKEAFTMLGKPYSVDIYGPLKDYTADELNGPHYRYHGPVDYSDVYAKLTEYDVLILPTYFDTEGYPGIILEAFAVGVPSITTDIGGIPELIENGVNGYLVPPRDAKALVDAVKKLEQANYTKLSQAAYDSFAQFDEIAVNEAVLQTATEL
ncbi:MAG: glycosyltransferase [Bacteroidaceae bacterium]|nr:glycosyltransferase [Bacteroidaceae bacterium]